MRHGTTFAEGMVTIARNEVAPNENDILLNVKLIQRDKGIAPGQFAAFYDGEVCLGAGVIADSSPSF